MINQTGTVRKSSRPASAFRKCFYLASCAAVAVTFNSSPGFAFLREIGKAVEKGARDAGKTIEKAAHDTGKTVEKAAHDTGKTAEKTAHDTGKTVEKAAQDTGKSIEKAVQDTGQAGETVYMFGIRQIEAIGTTLKDAEKRLGEGKIVDAWWHLVTDSAKHTEKNAATAMKESNIVRAVSQIAASAYGGPGGTAAFAAWLAYSETKDMGLALRVGAIAGAAAYASGAVSNMPSKDATAIAQKTILAGAIGGVAVAAAGGDKQAIQEGFLKAGGAVLVQSIYQKELGSKLDPKASRGEPYCMAAVDLNAKCAPPREAYNLDKQGKPVVGKDGLPDVDVRKTDPARPHVGTWAKPGDAPAIGPQETSAFMVSVSKVPGMNAMALAHDHLSYTMQFDPVTNVWTIVPAVAVTYYGTGAPAQDAIREAAKDDSKRPN